MEGRSKNWSKEELNEERKDNKLALNHQSSRAGTGRDGSPQEHVDA